MTNTSHRPQDFASRDASLSIEDVVTAVAAVAGKSAPLHEPEIAGNEWAYVKDCLDTGWVSSIGAYVSRFESQLCDLTGARFAIATSSGTAALHTSLILVGVGRDEEVIMPSLSFVATANAVAYCGAVPHFVDVDERTLCLDPARLDTHLSQAGERVDGVLRNKKTGRIIRCIVCMHAFGHPADLYGLQTVCARYGLPLVEDAAESLGSLYRGRHTGTFGVAAALSFNGNKIVTSGGGGAVLTNDEHLAKRARHLTTTAKVSHPWAFEHDEVGYNYRLTNISAAIGCAQLERLDDFVARKRRLAERYAAIFKGIVGVRFFTEPDECRSNYWLNVILLDVLESDRRDDILRALNDVGLMSRPAWTPMHRLPMYADSPRMDLSVTDSLHARLINIPSSPNLVTS